MHMSPFFGPGVYDLEIRLETGDSGTVANRFQVGFVDFVWGRDNLSFGNKDQYKSVVGTFGEVLSDWIRARVLAVVPGDAPGSESGRLSRTEVLPTGSTVTRRVPLR